MSSSSSSDADRRSATKKSSEVNYTVLQRDDDGAYRIVDPVRSAHSAEDAIRKVASDISVKGRIRLVAVPVRFWTERVGSTRTVEQFVLGETGQDPTPNDGAA
jgi:hypothetical protein